MSFRQSRKNSGGNTWLQFSSVAAVIVAMSLWITRNSDNEEILADSKKKPTM